MGKFTLKLQFFKTTKRYPHAGFEVHIQKTLKACVRCLSQLPVKVLHPLPKRIVLEIGSVGPAKMKEINHQTRGQRRPTDILSFRLADHGADHGYVEDITGSLVVCHAAILQKWGSEIRERGVKAIYHRLLIHGFVHLMGFDHHRKRDADAMRRIEKFLGVPNSLLD